MSNALVTSQKTVYKAALFEVKAIGITLANGKKKRHHIVERKPTASIFPIADNGDIFLVSQYRYVQRKMAIEAASGFIEEGETSLAAGKRELEEELGLTAHYWEEFGRLALAGSVVRSTVYLFFAKDLDQGKTNFDDEEDITKIRISLEDAVKKVMVGEITQAASVAGIMMLSELKRKKKI